MAKHFNVDEVSITDLKAAIKAGKLSPSVKARAMKSIAARRAHRKAGDAARARKPRKKK